MPVSDKKQLQIDNLLILWENWNRFNASSLGVLTFVANKSTIEK